MGGSIAVAVRFKDGRTVCQERWTNNMPYWLNHSKVFAGDEARLQEYINMTKDNNLDDGELGRPLPLKNHGYGLVVIDLKTMTFMDNQGYTSFGRRAAVSVAVWNHEDNSDFYEMVDQGKVFLRHYDAKTIDTLSCVTRDDVTRVLATRDYIGYDFIFDTDPMTMIEFPEFKSKDFQAKLRELEFPMTKKEGLNSCIYG